MANPSDPNNFTPFVPPNTASNPGAPPGNPFAPPGYGVGQGPTPVTKVNGTADPRIIWEDGHVAVIYGKDFPANSGMGRTRTRKDIKDAINAQIDDQLQTAPGAGSAHDFVKVWLKDLLARPLPSGPQAKIQGRLPIDPAQFKPVTPKVAQSGRYKGQIIPDFPHVCNACNGPFYQGMFSSVHPTPDGECPAKAPPKKRR